MSNRTVVSVEPRGENTIAIKLSKAPGAFPDARVPKLFDCSPDDMPPWTQLDAVQLHGRTIYDRLATHDAIRDAIREIERVQPPNMRSLYFHLVAEVAERLSWETLCGPKGLFFALDRRWPIARMADSEVDQGLPQGEFAPPLKVAAMMSALGKAAKPEWEGLREAVLKAQARAFDVALLVMVGEEDLLHEIEQDKQAAGLDWLTVLPMPTRVTDLDEALAQFQPHLIHFYSHGSTTAGVSQLQLATITDWDDVENRQIGSLVVDIEELMNFPALDTAWLVTLNCCVGARAANELHSMAHRLVAGGLPAAIGMTEPIDALDAHEFAQVFYPNLFQHLQNAVKAARASGKSVEFEWAPALHPARTALRDRYGAPDRRWTMPVLYVRPEPFEVRAVGPVAGPPGAPAAAVGPPSPAITDDPTVRARIDAVAGALRALPPETPSVARQELLALLADVPAASRPQLDGTFVSTESVNVVPAVAAAVLPAAAAGAS